MLHPYREIVFSSEKEWTPDRNNTEESQMHYTKWNKPYKTKQNSMEIWDGLHLEKQRLREGGVKHSLETSWLNLKGSQLHTLAGKKNQYAKSAENSGQTRPLCAPSTLSNPTAESSDPIRQQFPTAAHDSSLLPSTQLMLVQLMSPELELCLDYILLHILVSN